MPRTDVLFDRQPVLIDGRTSQKCETPMRFVTLNLDLQDAAALNRAVEASLAGCDCRKEGHGARCELCASLEPIHQDLIRLLTRPRLRLPAPLALNGDDGIGKTAASSGAQLRLLPPMTADM